MRAAVIGAGVFGAWTAKFLADDGCAVTMVDAYGAANSRASSADHTRVIRAGYGADEFYSRWACEAFADWRWLSHASGQLLLTHTGALFLGGPGDMYVDATFQTLRGMGRVVELLGPAELHARFPQIGLDGLGAAVFEADAGVLRATAAVQALVALLVRTSGVDYRHARVGGPDEDARTCRVVTEDGPLEADVYVFAAGPWLPALLPQAIGRRIRATRQEVLYFGTPVHDAKFSAPRLPVWIDFAAGLYGIPDLDGRGFKVGVDRHGPEIDPDTMDRLVEPALVRRTRDWIERRFPAMAGAPVVDSRVCQYENTSSGDFIIDRHPQWSNCWIAGGGSGHGFKHGPSIGRHVAALVRGQADVEPRFSLATKTASAARAVF